MGRSERKRESWERLPKDSTLIFVWKTILLLTAIEAIAFIIRLVDPSDSDTTVRFLIVAELILLILLFTVCYMRRYGRGPVVLLSAICSVIGLVVVIMRGFQPADLMLVISPLVCIPPCFVEGMDGYLREKKR